MCMQDTQLKCIRKQRNSVQVTQWYHKHSCLRLQIQTTRKYRNHKYMYIHTCTYTCIYIHVQIHLHIHEYTYLYIYMNIHTCTNTCIYIYIHVQIHYLKVLGLSPAVCCTEVYISFCVISRRLYTLSVIGSKYPTLPSTVAVTGYCNIHLNTNNKWQQLVMLWVQYTLV